MTTIQEILDYANIYLNELYSNDIINENQFDAINAEITESFLYSLLEYMDGFTYKECCTIIEEGLDGCVNAVLCADLDITSVSGKDTESESESLIDSEQNNVKSITLLTLTVFVIIKVISELLK